ncbi:MAG: hypothetical protein Q4C87_00425 [Actinomycetaceae bacterium]|nr:hypothetical protein [Actinomycetaceae bacterium]
MPAVVLPVSLPSGPTVWDGVLWPASPDEVVLLQRKAHACGDLLLVQLAKESALYLREQQASSEYEFEWACLLSEVYVDMKDYARSYELLATAKSMVYWEEYDPVVCIRILVAIDKLYNAEGHIVTGQGLHSFDQHLNVLYAETMKLLPKLQSLWEGVDRGSVDKNAACQLFSMCMSLYRSLSWLGGKAVEARDLLVSQIERGLNVLICNDWDECSNFSARYEVEVRYKRSQQIDIYSLGRSLEDMVRPENSASLSTVFLVYQALALLSNDYEQYDEAIRYTEKSAAIMQSVGLAYSSIEPIFDCADYVTYAGYYDAALSFLISLEESIRPHSYMSGVALDIRRRFVYVVAAYFDMEKVEEGDEYSPLTVGKYAQRAYDWALECAQEYESRDEVWEQSEVLAGAARACQWMKKYFQSVTVRYQIAEILTEGDEDGDYKEDIQLHLNEAIADLSQCGTCAAVDAPGDVEVRALRSKILALAERVESRAL